MRHQPSDGTDENVKISVSLQSLKYRHVKEINLGRSQVFQSVTNRQLGDKPLHEPLQVYCLLNPIAGNLRGMVIKMKKFSVTKCI